MEIENIQKQKNNGKERDGQFLNLEGKNKIGLL